MKKVVFILASILMIGFSSVNAQYVLKFKSFDFFKGVVSIDQNRYDSFTFLLKIKKKNNIEVSSVLVNGVEGECQITEWGVFKMYTVLIPKKAHTIVGKQFDVTINFGTGGFLMSAFLSTDRDDKSDGGPGSGGDPTVIIIKYP